MLAVRLLVVATVLLAACTSGPSADRVVVTELSGPMPALSGETLDGASVGPDDLRGRPAVINFWATWCGPCRREQPVLNAAYAAAGDTGPVFVGVNYRDDPAAARAYWEEFDVGYASLQDPSGSLAYRFDVPFLPATVFVDAAGEMRYRVVGELTEERLDELLGRIS